ncbi:[protein-PII] uridylyltransferase [Oricola cellulosilytica]|uniref:Bifunctional uridylyltransferase/uridylyl-removing enzyme n=1 Tax=Oricola cellulosilytica TaxID=1429082 RepID=A0A4R0PF98_9HYPH|nr:[protein-PII] uridylyltransferase [Oricola cellulosilytica]TCD16301.1 [protein-PII] uridylyltransferase [Oricola cellulosilytica]
MSTAAKPPLPGVDHESIRTELSAIAARHGDGGSPAARTDVLAHLKWVLATGRQVAERRLFESGKGTDCAKQISDLLDAIVRAVYDFALNDVFRVNNLSSGERLALVAVGGYGRATLAPGSDIDLLFVLPYKQTPLGEQLAEYILYMLWDLSLKVGHATRSVDECVRLSKTDATISTSILDARYIYGEKSLFKELQVRFDEEVVSGSASSFIQAKLAERDARHKRMGETRYVVEPNIKDGKGGLRDLQTLFWIAKYFYRVSNRAELVKKGVFSRAEYNLFVKCEDFLWAVRCHLHFLTGKAEERIGFEVQRDLADRLDYKGHAGLKGVERFMKHYFLIAKDVGDLTRIFCAQLEEEDVKQVPSFNRLLQTLPFNRRTQKIRGTSDFIIDNKRINIADKKTFSRDPVNIIRMFWFADRDGLDYHPDALQLVRRSLKLIKKSLRNDPEANRLFVEILTSHKNPGLNLRRMNEAGVLGRFIPDFGKVVAMMQFNMYHHFTVDEHLIRSVDVLSSIEQGNLEEEHPLASALLPELEEHRRILYVALFLHDIAKGRPEDHSIAGAAVAEKLCPRLGLTTEETETVAWLIREHLSMSTVAQSRDLSDRKTIEDFASTVQTLFRLKLLVILTVCDIRAVGPGVWNGWKGQLLRTLFTEVEIALTGDFAEINRKDRAALARKELAERLSHWPRAARTRHVSQHYDNYLLTVDIDDQVRHAEFMREALAADQKLATEVRTSSFQAITEITVLAPDHPRLLSVIAAACSSAGAKIDGAHIFTTRDGWALDTIFINREFTDDGDELRRAKRIGRAIEDVLSGKTYLPDILAHKMKPKRTLKAFSIQPAVAIKNTLSNRFSVIEIEGLDRPGILSEITGALSDLTLDIRSAHITTFGEKVVDTFYVTDLTGQKITDPSRQKRIRKVLVDVLKGRADENPVVQVSAGLAKSTPGASGSV